MRSRTFISDIVLNFQIISLCSFFGSKYIVVPTYCNKELIYDHCPFLTIDYHDFKLSSITSKDEIYHLHLKFYVTLSTYSDPAKIKSKVPKDQKLHLTPNQSLPCL